MGGPPSSRALERMGGFRDRTRGGGHGLGPVQRVLGPCTLLGPCPEPQITPEDSGGSSLPGQVALSAARQLPGSCCYVGPESLARVPSNVPRTASRTTPGGAPSMPHKSHQKRSPRHQDATCQPDAQTRWSETHKLRPPASCSSSWSAWPAPSRSSNRQASTQTCGVRVPWKA